MGKPSPFQLLAAQAAVAETMEKQWFQDYLDFLTAEDSEEEEAAEDAAAKKPVCREHTVSFHCLESESHVPKNFF